MWELPGGKEMILSVKTIRDTKDPAFNAEAHPLEGEKWLSEPEEDFLLKHRRHR